MADPAGDHAKPPFDPRFAGPWLRGRADLARLGAPLPEDVSHGGVLTQETGSGESFVEIGGVWLQATGPSEARLVTWLLPGAQVDDAMLDRQERFFAVLAGSQLLIDHVVITRTGAALDNRSGNDKLRALHQRLNPDRV